MAFMASHHVAQIMPLGQPRLGGDDIAHLLGAFIEDFGDEFVRSAKGARHRPIKPVYATGQCMHGAEQVNGCIAAHDLP